ncbi:hypothetical protein ABPG75_012271 [Micractinium tetrahymenae]
MEALLASVSQLVESRQFDEVGTALDEAELEEPSTLSSERWPHALHLLAHVYAGRLEDARFLYKRTPENIRQGSPELAAAFALLQRLWVKDYQHVWAALQFAWSAQVAPLAAALADRLRSRQLSLVARAYANISVPKLAALLGCSEAEAAQAASGQGWAVGQDGLVEVKPPGAGAAASSAAAEQALQRLTSYVVHLES